MAFNGFTDNQTTKSGGRYYCAVILSPKVIFLAAISFFWQSLGVLLALCALNTFYCSVNDVKSGHHLFQTEMGSKRILCSFLYNPKAVMKAQLILSRFIAGGFRITSCLDRSVTFVEKKRLAEENP